jgi:hypothetical protein
MGVGGGCDFCAPCALGNGGGGASGTELGGLQHGVVAKVVVVAEVLLVEADGVSALGVGLALLWGVVRDWILWGVVRGWLLWGAVRGWLLRGVVRGGGGRLGFLRGVDGCGGGVGGEEVEGLGEDVEDLGGQKDSFGAEGVVGVCHGVSDLICSIAGKGSYWLPLAGAVNTNLTDYHYI